MKDLFNERQEVILKFLNNYRKYVDIPHIGNNKIVKAFPNGVVIPHGKEYKWFFWGKDVITDELLKANFFSLQKYKEYRYAWLNNTFNTGAGDGQLRAVAATWAGSRDATSANDSVDYTSTNFRIDALYNGSNYFVGRGRLVFDTSALPDSATINSATIALNVESIGSNPYDEGGSAYLVNVASALGAFTTLTANDFDNFGTTDHGTTAFTISGAGSSSISLNATGIAAISKTSYSDWGLKWSRDLNNSSPGGTGGQQATISSSENSTSSNRPVLTVVTPDVAGGGAFLLNFV